MAFFIPALLGALATAMASLVGRVVIALGIGFVTYTGITISITAMRDSVIASMQGLPADAVSLASYLWIDKALTVLFSAVTISLTMKLTEGAVKKMVFK